MSDAVISLQARLAELEGLLREEQEARAAWAARALKAEQERDEALSQRNATRREWAKALRERDAARDLARYFVSNLERRGFRLSRMALQGAPWLVIEPGVRVGLAGRGDGPPVAIDFKDDGPKPNPPERAEARSGASVLGMPVVADPQQPAGEVRMVGFKGGEPVEVTFHLDGPDDEAKR
jgi:hypothetical protein